MPLLDSCINVMQQHAVNAGKVNWNTLKQNAYAKAAGITDAYQLGPAIRYLYQSLNDYHGKFFYKDSVFQWAHNVPMVSDAVKKEWQKRVTLHPMILDNHMGYLRMPSMPYPAKADADREAQLLNDTLCFLLNQQIKGLIIDARLDGGGSMYPMVLGLEQLLQPGKLGSFTGKKMQNWKIVNHNFYLDTSIVNSILPHCNINGQSLPLVILAGPGTGSSGEFFLMAFKSRKKTVVVGDPTAGWVTSIAGMPVTDSAYIYLSTGYGKDANGKLYTEAIPPDIMVHATDKFNAIEQDEKVKAALRWLQQQL